MNDKIYIFLIFSFLLFTFSFITGCGKYITQYSAPVIIARHPTNEASGISSNETLWIKFSKSMDENNMGTPELFAKVVFASDMTATATFYPDLTCEAVWSDDNTVLTIRNVFFISTEAAARVHIISSREAFIDTNGLYITEGAKLWNYTLQ